MAKWIAGFNVLIYSTLMALGVFTELYVLAVPCALMLFITSGIFVAVADSPEDEDSP